VSNIVCHHHPTSVRTGACETIEQCLSTHCAQLIHFTLRAWVHAHVECLDGRTDGRTVGWNDRTKTKNTTFLCAYTDTQCEFALQSDVCKNAWVMRHNVHDACHLTPPGESAHSMVGDHSTERLECAWACRLVHSLRVMQSVRVVHNTIATPPSPNHA
jgi:hypothetical protein